VFATAIQVDRQWPPAAIGHITPAFTWQVGDGANTGSPTNMLRLNLGSPLADDTRGLAIGDLDGDGRPDVVVGNNSLQTYALLNTSDNPTNWPRLNLGSPAVLPTYAVAIGDVTGDGRPDVVLGNYFTQNVVMVNNGGSPDTWLRVNLGSALNDYTSGVAIGDVTGDGRPDVVVGNSGGQDYVLVNDGGNPAGWARVNLAGAVNGTTYGVAIGDLTGDGLPDVALGNYGQSQVAVNNGGSPATWSRVNLGPVLGGYTYGVTLGDLNGDGRLDAVLARGTYSDQINQVILNHGGSPSNWPAWSLSTSTENSSSAAIADLNGDGRPDLVFGNNGPDSVYLNDGRTPTNWPRAKLGSGPSDVTYAVAVGDLDGDSRPDVVVGNSVAQNIAVLNTTTSMPCTQAGYQVQVARAAAGLGSGSLFWDSGITNLPTVGDGIAAILQDRACTNSGDYYWRVRTFSTSGMQSEWTAPQRYAIPTNPVYLSLFRPIPPQTYATNTPMAVTGWLSLNVQTAAWTNLTTGGAGVIAGAGGWTQNVALAAGTNTLRFTAGAAGALAVTQTLAAIYLTNTPSVLLAAPNTGQSFTTTAFSVQMAGTLTAPLDLWGSRVFWTNASAGVGGVMSRTAMQAVWPAGGTIEVALQPKTNNTIRVWCDSQMGGPIEARLTVGCFDPILPTMEIRQPNGGRDVTLYTNVVVLTGTAGDNGTLVAVAWSNVTTGVGGVGAFERMAGVTSGWWRTPVVSLAPGSQQFAVWAIDSWTNVGVSDTITITFNTNGLPGELAAYPTGAVFATSLQANRQWLPVTLGDSRPQFSWMFGDAVNNGVPTNLTRVSLGSAQIYQTYALAAGDLSGDGRPDVAIGNNGDPNYVAINNGGSPATWTRMLLGSSLNDLTWSLALGDVTGDGLPDVVVGNNGQQNYVMVNNGGWPTNWSRVNLGTGLNDSTYSVAVGDVTGDGRLDVVVGNYSQPSYVLVNNGNSPTNWPRFTLGSASNSLTYSVAIGDLTGDGRPDVVVGNYNQANYVLVNTGTNPAAWSRVRLGSAQNNYTFSLAIGDMNDDDRPDVVVGNYGQQKYLLLNTGDSPSNWPRLVLGPASVENTFRVAIADINGDGRPDVVAGNAAQQNNALLNMDGSPSNWPRVNLGSASADMTYGLAVGDVNRDGRPDVVAGNWREQITVLTNNAKAMPFTQVGYQVQVAVSPEALMAGSTLWDSGITNLAATGDGLTSVRQGVSCPSVGTYYWRVRVFSSSGLQSDWTAPARYDYTVPEAPFVDTDGDGLPDWWEALYCGGATNATPGADLDGDLADNWSEYIAGTDPTNRMSCLKLDSPAPSSLPGVTGIVVRWFSATGKYYRLNRSTNLLSGFADFKTNIPAIPVMNTETDTTATGQGPYFYRVIVDP
jgi:hypothetical protein